MSCTVVCGLRAKAPRSTFKQETHSWFAAARFGAVFSSAHVRRIINVRGSRMVKRSGLEAGRKISKLRVINVMN